MIDYDYIVKTETFDEDALYLIQNKLAGRGSAIKANSWRRAGLKGNYLRGPGLKANSLNGLVKLPRFGIELPEYKSIPIFMMKKIADMYEKDFDLFGYEHMTQNGTVYTNCMNAEDGCC